MSALRIRALEQVAAAPGGLLVERGWESVTQNELTDDGLLFHEIENGKSKFTLSDQGRRALASAGVLKETIK